MNEDTPSLGFVLLIIGMVLVAAFFIQQNIPEYELKINFVNFGYNSTSDIKVSNSNNLIPGDNLPVYEFNITCRQKNDKIDCLLDSYNVQGVEDETKK